MLAKDSTPPRGWCVTGKQRQPSDFPCRVLRSEITSGYFRTDATFYLPDRGTKLYRGRPKRCRWRLYFAPLFAELLSEEIAAVAAWKPHLGIANVFPIGELRVPEA